MTDSLFRLSAADLAKAIRSKQVSSLDAVQSFLNRIEDVNPRLNAVVTLNADAALAEARSADGEQANGQLRGALHGVPITVKDSIEVAGMRCTGGTLGLSSHLPSEDASVVSRMKEAGAIILGKTNCPELCMAFESDNLIFGATNNPYDATRTAGGSSGGEAAIIAAGGSPLGLGSDAGGSIREPSHFSGVAGIKPTSGRVPRTGHIPPPGGVFDSLWQIGPMARSVDDLALALRIISGVDDRDAAIVPMPLGDPAKVDVRSLRVAFYTRNKVVDATPETVETVRKVASFLDESKLRVSETTPPLLEDSHLAWLKMIGPDGGQGIEEAAKALGSHEIHSTLQGCLRAFRSQEMSCNAFWNFVAGIDAYRSRMLGFMKEYDVILCPACVFPAVPHGTTWNMDVYPGFSYTIDYNFTGYPGAVMRAGTSPENLPIGVQIVAKPWREDVCLAVAKMVEEEFSQKFEMPMV